MAEGTKNIILLINVVDYSQQFNQQSTLIRHFNATPAANGPVGNFGSKGTSGKFFKSNLL